MLKPVSGCLRIFRIGLNLEAAPLAGYWSIEHGGSAE
jgi:hypothetical protein